MVAKDFVCLSDEYLLNLRMKVGLGLFNKNQMQEEAEGEVPFLRLDRSCLLCQRTVHTYAKAHQPKYHRNQILVTQSVILFG